MPGKEEVGGRSFGVLIARTASSIENPMDALNLAKAILAKGRRVGIFLVADGVYVGKDGTSVAKVLADLLEGGAKILASPEHVKASGIPKEKMVPGIEVADHTYRDIVNFVMEEYDKVVVC